MYLLNFDFLQIYHQFPLNFSRIFFQKFFCEVVFTISCRFFSNFLSNLPIFSLNFPVCLDKLTKISNNLSFCRKNKLWKGAEVSLNFYWLISPSLEEISSILLVFLLVIKIFEIYLSQLLFSMFPQNFPKCLIFWNSVTIAYLLPIRWNFPVQNFDFISPPIGWVHRLFLPAT